MQKVTTSTVGFTAGLTVPMRNAAGADIGTLAVTETAGGLAIAGMLRGLPPGTRAIHLHTTGQCTAPFESAGGHWNPTAASTARTTPQGAHLGPTTTEQIRPAMAGVVQTP